MPFKKTTFSRKSHRSLFNFLTIAFCVFLSMTGFVYSNLADEIPTAMSKDSNFQLSTILNSNERSPKNRARDQYRHPLATLEFFGLRPYMTVVELWPGNGWYTEILAPHQAPKGQLIVTNFDPKTNKQAQMFQETLAKNPAIFEKVKVVEIAPPNQVILAPDNSVDIVLTFRNIHNWLKAGYAQEVYTAVYKALKPGGILGVVEHRAKSNTSGAESNKTGYLPEDLVITSIEKAGFKLVDKSEINANPKDTKDYPGGVWTLPPVLSQGENNKEKYLAIGESDRMTLKFIKPNN